MVVASLYWHTVYTTLVCEGCVDSLARTNNPALLQLLLALASSLDQAAVRTLIVKIITTCPDLLVPFLNSALLTFDPRPSTKWVNNTELLLEV